MPTNSKVALVIAAMLLGVTSASAANERGPPKIDIQKTCRESSSALTALTETDSQDSMSSCMNDEQAAREQMIKDWATYPALAKTQCIQPKEYLPGYVEWQACLDMTRDVLNLRKQQAASANARANTGKPSSNRRAGSRDRECPIVQTAEDGSIDWVINC